MSFKDIRGQDKAIAFLKQSVAQGRVAHAYLFLGPEGSGRFKTATEFARYLNCEKSGNEPCGECIPCSRSQDAVRPDIVIISRQGDSSVVKIDQIRELKQKFSLKAFESKYKIAIIKDAGHMTEDASNSLLKMLEEPSGDTVFILITSNESRLFDTIVSRCQAVRFKPLGRPDVYNILRNNFQMDDKDAKVLSAISSGNVKKAVMLKEKDALAQKNRIIDFFSSVSGSTLDEGAVISQAERGSQVDAMDILTAFYRDIAAYKLTGDEGIIINIDKLGLIKELSQAMEIPRIMDCISHIEETKELLESNVNVKLALNALKERLI